MFVPGSDLEYYKVTFRTDSFFEINRERDIVLRLKGITYYGQGYGGTKGLPFMISLKWGDQKAFEVIEK